MREQKGISRRDFLRFALMTPFALNYSPWLSPVQTDQTRSKVVLIRHPDVVDDRRKVKPQIFREMLDEALKVLLEAPNADEAWKKIIKPEDVVGIKSNVWSYLPTGREVEEVIKDRVLSCGVSEERIGVDDRGVLRNKIFRQATALINVRPIRTHYWSGIGGCLKNLITFAPDPSAYHPDTCADLALLWNNPLIKGKVRLNILLMLTPLFHGVGPHHFNEKYVWPYKGILLSQDPVAVDSIGVLILQAKRREFFGEERPLQPPAHHIIYAETRHRLGIANPQRIDLIKLGWSEGSLI
ncbi:MAG: DUF362 domain-containing protein [Candidatus Aminicenantes bacterium]|nr:DUF362 domain-containing protein [Candidatus Aminicenantes bacterium]